MAEEITLSSKDRLRQLREYFESVRIEMKRVTWPQKQEVYGTTVMVVLSTFLFAIYFATCDAAFKKIVQHVLDLFLHRR